MPVHYSFPLVLFSVFVATLASYTALNLASRIISLNNALPRQIWLVGGALSLGAGLWSMHFAGMLAMAMPIKMQYDVRLTFFSLFLAVCSSYFALYVITRRSLGLFGVLSSALVLAIGMVAMHHTAIAAMGLVPGFAYNPRFGALSLGISLIAAYLSVRGARAIILIGGRRAPKVQCLAAVAMGFALCATHYAAMHAVTMRPGTVCTVKSGLDPAYLSVSVVLFALATLTLALLLSLYDKRTSVLADYVNSLSDQIVRMASFDPLTNLANRHTVNQCIRGAIENYEAGDKGFAVLYLDLDQFKIVNDSLGHNVGDDLLRDFSGRLRACVGERDTVGRVGGDEFVVVLLDIVAAQEAEEMAKRIVDAMKPCSWIGGHLLQTTPSIGIALFPQHGSTVDDLLKNADSAMYEAKKDGRGWFRTFEQSMSDNAARMILIQSALNEALENEWFYLNYQPKFDCNSSELTGAEALLRLNHPRLGMLSPQEFIPVAERSGQIIEIGYWVIREVCAQIEKWDAEGMVPVKVAINLSPKQINALDFVDTLLEIVPEGRSPAQRIMFEITETYAMQDAARTAVVVQALKAAGFDIAIDDFGSGCSSLAHLQRFGVIQLKIDREFTNELDGEGLEGKAIVDAIIKLGHSLGMHVVAEGVETDSQLLKLRGMACDEVQGYLTGRPLSVRDFSYLMHGRATA